MTNEIRFGWIGETRRRALHTLLASIVDEWASDWWVDSASGAVDVHAADLESVQEKRNSPWLSTTETSLLALFLGAKDFDSFGRYLVGTTSDSDFELAQRIGEDALTDLAARIQRRAGLVKVSSLSRDVAPIGVAHARLGAFCVAVAMGRLKFEIAIDRRLADRLVPPTSPKTMGLVSRQSAVQQAPLRVVAMMDFGSVDLAHLSDLCVGEVLVGDRKLDEALQIHLEGYGAVVRGYLRRIGVQRAVVLDGVSQQETFRHE
jgi:hypothetical protein